MFAVDCVMLSVVACVCVCVGGGGGPGGGTLGIFLKDFLMNTSLLSASSRDVT